MTASTASSADGKYRLEVEPPPGIELAPDAYVIRLTANEPVETWTMSLLDWSEDFWNQQPGEYTYTARICEATQRPLVCGPESNPVSVQVEETAPTGAPPEDWTPPQRSGAAGPDEFMPGLYESTLTKWNGWQFNWINSLMWQSDPTETNDYLYHLTIRWTTYEWSIAENGYTPIWIWAQVDDIDGSENELSGMLYYRQESGGDYTDYNIGEIKLDFDPNKPEEVDIEWRTQRSGMYGTQATYSWVSDTLEYADRLGDPQITSDHDHYQGAWRRRLSPSEMDSSFTVETWIDAGVEIMNVLFFDANGKPVWAQASKPVSDPGTGLEEFCAYAVFDAEAPDTTPSPSHSPTITGLGCQTGTSQRNAGRTYDPVDPGQERSATLWLDFTLPFTRPGSLQVGTQSSHDPIEKWTHFHDIRAFSDGNPGLDVCYFQPGGSCSFSLRWHLAGDYTDAAVFRKTLPSGSPQLVTSGIDPSEPEYAYQTSTTGEYEFQIRRTSSPSSTLIARSHPFEVAHATTETPPAPAANPEFMASTTSAQEGATRGEFDVSESGAATYSIPIMTAPGSGGMAPEVSFKYNSEAGAGAMGRGWQIGGLSAITRCGKTLEAGDGESAGVQLNDEDRFCLDGQRLIKVDGGGGYGAAGSVYRLEVDQLVRVTAIGGSGDYPTHFQVERKDGSVSIYGSSSSSSSARIDAPDAGVIYAWPISRVEDSASNYIVFEYLQPSSGSIEWHPLQIHYTGNDSVSPPQLPYATITFDYDPKPAAERVFSYVAGDKLESTQWLQSVDSRGDSSQLLRHYKLGYNMDGHDRNLLTSIRECWSASAATCFEPTTFEWNDTTLSLSFPSTKGGVTLSDFENGRIADVNGNGMGDYIYLEKFGAYLRFRYLLASVNSSGTISHSLQSSGYIMWGNPDPEHPPAWTMVDVTGNGYQEIVYIVDGTIHMHAWEGSGYTAHQTLGYVGEDINPGDVIPADWDGDGRPDLVVGKKLDEGDPVPGFLKDIWVFRNTSSGGSASFDIAESLLIDYQLDPPYQGLPTCYGTSHPCSGTGTIGHEKIWVSIVDGQAADFSGDGQVEFLVHVHGWYCDEPGGCSEQGGGGGGKGEETSGSETLFAFYALMSLGEDNSGNPAMVIHNHIGESTESHVGTNTIQFIRTADFNGDGLSDLLMRKSTSGWVLRMNKGGDFEPEVAQPNLSGLGEDEAVGIRFAPVSGDGTLDIIGIERSGSTNWMRHFRWDWDMPGWGSNTISSVDAGNLYENQWLFRDLTGNGKVDTIRIRHTSGDDWKLSSIRGWGSSGNIQGGHGYDGLFRIHRLTDGLGAWTEIDYKSLVQRSVYTRDNNGPYTGYGMDSVVYDVVPSVYVVAQATSLSPQVNGAGQINPNGTTALEYYYTGAKLQGGGRGFLGFREVASYDPQSRMLTRTRYHQDFPLIGLPEETHSWYIQPGQEPWDDSESQGAVEPCTSGTCSNDAIDSSGIELGHSKNTWDEKPTIAGLSHPYLSKSEEWGYIPTYSSGTLISRILTHRVVTETEQLDDYGHPGLVRVITYSGSGIEVSRQTTVNEFDTSPGVIDAWQLGRLTCATVTSERGSEFVTRRSTFEYDEATGMLTSETTAATSCSDHSGALTKSYLHDDFGNRWETTVTGADISQDRKSRRVHDPMGRYVWYEQVHLNGGWRETRRVLSRDKYGNVLQERNAQGVTGYNYYDAMGRPHYSYTPDGAWSQELYSSSTAGCPTGTAFKVIRTEAGGGQAEVCKDVLARETRTRSRGFSGEWIYQDTVYDHAARPVRASEPYKAGDTSYWTETVYDEVGRVEFVLLPDGNSESYSYYRQGSGVSQGVRTSHTDAEGKVHRSRRNALGEKIHEQAADGGVTTYDYDALGQLTDVDGPLANDTVTIVYDDLGHKESMSDPDKGDWSYRHNALGELVCQIADNGRGTHIERDELGRKTARHDRTGVTSLTSCTGTTLGTTSWLYGATPLTPEFGQVEFSSAQYNDGNGANHTTTRDYFYDGLGRLESVDTEIADGSFSRSYTESTTFDQYGRVFQAFDASGGDRGVRPVYNAFGYRAQLRESRHGVAGQVYWTVQAMDAHGNVTEALMGNGTEVLATHDPATGALEHRIDDTGQTVAQDLWLDWDAVGNLERRHDLSGTRDQEERFFYDDRHRLKQVESRSKGGAWTVRQRLNYNAAGNITCKSDVSTATCSTPSAANYSYGTGGSGPGPHAVTSAGSLSLTYDAHGNVVSDTAGRSFDYTTFDKVRRVGLGTEAVEFHYGAGRARTLKREMDGGFVASRTHYVGAVEVVLDGINPGPGEFRRQIGGMVIATYFAATDVSQTRYLHTDHLGSITAISNESGQVVTWMSYDAWGKRRNADAWHPYSEPPAVWLNAMLDITPRGFTGHEHVDLAGIIHMNGRIYDPHLGRFLQADPFMEDSTTLNRYTYVHNNPLAYTDPSGYLSVKGVFKIAVAVAISVYTGGVGVGAFSMGSISGGLSGFAVATAGGFAAGAITTGTLEGALWGAFTAAIFTGIGAHYYEVGQASRAAGDAGVLGTGLGSKQFAEATVTVSVTGGVLSKMQGGKFGHGFFSAGAGFVAGPGLGRIGNDFGRGVAAAVVGGTVSEVTGGKFANGAVTAAFSSAFGQLAARQGGRGNDGAPPSVTDGGGDVIALQTELDKLPPEILAELQDAGVTFVAVEDSVVEYLSHLSGKQVPGWPEGKTWDSVPGVYNRARRAVVIATSGKFGHGSYNLALHETGHAYDHINGSLSGTRLFERAYQRDYSSLSGYERSSAREAFAEGFANYYGGNARQYRTHAPSLYTYWDAR